MRPSFKSLVATSLICSFAASSVRAENASQEPIRAVNAPQKAWVQEPSVSTLTGLLGHKIEDKTVQNFIKAQHMGKIAKGGSGSYSRYAQKAGDEPASFSLMFSNSMIVRVIISLAARKEVASPYGGTLPFGVQATDSPQIIRKRFGKARYDIVGKYPNKPGNGWLGYDKGTTEVTFSFSHNKMEEIYLDTPGRF